MDDNDEVVVMELQEVDDPAELAAFDVGFGMGKGVSLMEGMQLSADGKQPETGTENPSEKPVPEDGKKPKTRSKGKAEKPEKKDDVLGKGMTLEEMIAKRDALRTDAKSWTDAIDKRKREEKAKEEKAKRLQEQRDALEFYRKYRGFVEAAKRLTLRSGKTAFEWIEEAAMNGRNGQEG